MADVITFVNHFGNKLRDMSRDKIRLYVKKLRGEEVPEEDGIITDGEKKSAQMMLPGFERSVDLFRDLTPETARVMVKSRDVADKAVYGGMILVDSYVDYVRRNVSAADTETLHDLKAQLLDLIDRIDALDLPDDDAPEIAACGNEMKFTQGEEPAEEPAEDVPEDLAEEVPEDLAEEVIYHDEEEEYHGGGTGPGIAAAATGFAQTSSEKVREEVARKIGFDFDIGSVIGSE